MSLPTQSIGGLISGFDTASIIEQLMAIERRPVKMMEADKVELEGKQEAWRSINRMLLDFKGQVDVLGKVGTYNQKTAASSNESLLAATADDSAPTGSYTFRTIQAAQSHQVLSGGFDSDNSPVGAGEISIDLAGASLKTHTKIESLNGGAGAFRGAFRITDRSGASAIFDISGAETLDEVIDAINDNDAIDVTAAINSTGTGIDLTDNTGAVASNFTVASLNGGSTAEDLGIADSVAGAAISGGDVYRLAGTTALSSLRDGRGIDDGTLGSIRITDTVTSKTYTVDLSQARNLQQVADAVEEDSDGDFSLTFGAKGLTLTNNLGNAFTVEDDTADDTDTTATDLGIAGSSAGASLTGSNILGGIDTVLVDSLTGADGGAWSFGQMDVTDRAGNIMTVDMSTGTSLQDAVDEINNQAGIKVVQVTASINDDGNGIVIEDTSGATASNLIIADSGTSTGASDLNLTVDAAIETVNGGAAKRFGIDLGQIDIQDREGDSVLVDLSGAETLQEILDTINTAAAGAGVDVTVGLNDAGNGLLLTDNTGATGNLMVGNVAGSQTATTLGLEVNAAVSEVDGGDLDRKYVSRSTKLEDLNAGAGVYLGKLRITDGNGLTAEGDISQIETVGEVVSAINASGLAVEARVNTTGDGIMLINTARTGALKVEELGGTAAEDLGLLGSASDGATLYGSQEKTITIDDNDSLRDIVYKIGMSGAPVSTNILDDGSEVNSKHLTISSRNSGAQGMLVIDSSIAGLDFADMTKAQDALLLYGASGGGVAPVLLSSESNTFTGAVPGLSLDLKDVDPNRNVTITVDQDTESIGTAVNDMVTKYNEMNELIHVLTAWDSEEEMGGLLFGDSNLHGLMNSLSDMLMETVEGVSGGITQWYDLGVEFAYDEETQQGYLDFDAAKLETQLSTNFEGVKALMTKTTDMARGDRNASAAASRPAGAVNKPLETFDEGNGGVPGANNFADDADKWFIHNSQLGANTDASGNIYIQAQVNAANDWNLLAYKDAAMTELVAAAYNVNYNEAAEDDGSATFNLFEENDSGLGVTVAIDDSLVDGDTVTISNLDDQVTSIQNIINGNSSSSDLGPDNGYVGAKDLNETGEETITINLDQPRPIYQLILHHPDSEDMPADEYALRRFTVEYFDTYSKTWKEAQNYEANRSSINYISLPDNVMTDQIRIVAQETNAADGRVRLIEVEALESEGAASQMRTRLKSLTNNNDGLFASVSGTIEEQIKDIDNRIEKMEGRLESKELNLMREFSAMEQALAQMQSQSDFFNQQMSSFNNNDR